MAYTTINKHTAHFNTKLYTGNNGSQSITGVGFQPDMTWIKKRDGAADSSLMDSVRGVRKSLTTNNAEAEYTETTGLSSWDADGFSFDGAGFDHVNTSNTFVSWNWKAGTTGSGSTTGGGTSKTYNYSVNTTAGFSIVTYTGNGNSGHTVPHHLGTTPNLIIAKETGAADYWRVYNPNLTTNYNLYLNTTHAQDSASDGYLGTPDATNITFGGASNTNTVNQDGITYVAYCFAEKTGYSQFGAYKGNGQADGAFIYTGFTPSFVMFKRYDGGTENWAMMDSARSYHNVGNHTLAANSSNGESSFGGGESVNGASNKVDIVSNGIKIREASNYNNTDGATYIYIAFGQTIVGTNNVPATAR